MSIVIDSTKASENKLIKASIEEVEVLIIMKSINNLRGVENAKNSDNLKF